MRILHFSDIHLWNYGLDRDPTFKRALGVANLMLRRARAFPPALSRAVLERIATTDADVVCFTGDISTSSLRREFERGREALAAIAAKWGDRLLAIPGNHDRYTRRSSRRALFEEYFAHEPIDFPFLRSIGDVDFVGVDTTRPCFWTSRGSFPRDRQRALAELLRGRDNPERPLVVLSHYPYALPGSRPHRWQHRLEEAPALAGLIAEHRPKLVLHGHVHRRWAHRPPSTPDTLCVNSGSAGQRSHQADKSAGFVLIDLDKRRGDVERVTAIAQQPGGPLGSFAETPLWPYS